MDNPKELCSNIFKESTNVPNLNPPTLGETASSTCVPLQLNVASTLGFISPNKFNVLDEHSNCSTLPDSYFEGEHVSISSKEKVKVQQNNNINLTKKPTRGKNAKKIF